MTWEKLSLRWRREDTDPEESLDGLEGLATPFPLSGFGLGTSIFCLLIAWEDCMGEKTWLAWAFGFFGGARGGNDKDIVGQPWWWATGWWTISFQPSLAGGSSYIDTWGERRYQKIFEVAGREVSQVGAGGSHGQLGWRTQLERANLIPMNQHQNVLKIVAFCGPYVNSLFQRSSSWSNIPTCHEKLLTIHASIST